MRGTRCETCLRWVPDGSWILRIEQDPQGAVVIESLSGLHPGAPMIDAPLLTDFCSFGCMGEWIDRRR